ncbi:hypothetical protein CRG98_041144 [Punica granatum]|uniref:Uncharacterized protein n=1 Tax=Punica granatum TaxID=22663 RepID=A0A2I0I375_PUNGR|nr:hypothetical protein CRG98_041144 [Punica granatum]
MQSQTHCFSNEMLPPSPLSFKASNLFAFSKHLQRFGGCFSSRSRSCPSLMASLSTVPGEKAAVVEHDDSKKVTTKPLQLLAYISGVLNGHAGNFLVNLRLPEITMLIFNAALVNARFVPCDFPLLSGQYPAFDCGTAQA